MKKVTLPLFAFLFFFFVFLSKNSYALIQAGAHLVNQNEVDIRVKPNADINMLMSLGHFSFTLRCPNNTGTAFIAPSSILYTENPYGFGAPVITSNINYIFISFNITKGSYFNVNWLNNTENSIVKFKITGGAGRADFMFDDVNPAGIQLDVTLVDAFGSTYSLTPPPGSRYYQQTLNNVPLGLVADFGIPPTICEGYVYTWFSNLSLGTTPATTYELDFDGPGSSFSFNGPSTSFNLISSVQYTNTIPTQVTLRVTDGLLTDQITKNITINPLPIPPLTGHDTSVCVGENIFLTASYVSNASYNWFGPGGYTSNVQNPNAIVATSSMVGTPQNYGVTVTVNGCTSAAEWTQIIVNAPITIDAGNNISVCQNATANLNASIGTGGTGRWNLISSPVLYSTQAVIALADQTNPNAPLITSVVPGTYVLEFVNTTPNTCPASDQVIVNIYPAPTSASGQTNSPRCEGETIILTVNSPQTGLIYEWTGPGNWHSTGTTVTRQAAAATAGPYFLYVSNSNCTTGPFGPYNVTVNPMPTVDAGNNITIQCIGTTSVNLSGSASGGTPTWSLVSGPSGTILTNLISSSDINNPTAAINTSAPLGTYTLRLTVTSANGCSVYDNVLVQILYNNIPPTPSFTATTPVCEGGIITLKINSPRTGEFYQWSGPNAWSATGTLVTRNANSAAQGNYTLIASNGTCSSAPSAPVSVTVNPLPTVDAGQNVYVQCQGTPASLTGSVTGGTPTWTLVSGPSGTIITNLISTANINNPTAPLIASAPIGTYTLQLTVTTTNSCTASDQVTVTIANPSPQAPSAVTSNSPLCAGTTINLNVVGPISGYVYSWTGPNGYTATGSYATRPATSLASGLYSVTASLGACTNSTPASITVTVNPLPTVDAGSNVDIQCQGTAASLSGSYSGGTALWSLVSGPSGTLITNLLSTANLNNPTSPLITSAPLGTYTLRLTATTSNNCTAYDDVLVSINHPQPSIPSGVSNPPQCEGGTIILTVNTPKTGETYQWTGPNSYHGSGSTINRVANSANAGNYYITASNGTCTSQQSSPINVVVYPLPTVEAGPSVNIQCQGTAANLSGSVTGGTAYWSLINGPSGTLITNLINITDINNPNASLITTSAIGTYLIQFNAVTTNGCVAQDQTTVTINHPQPQIPSGVSNSPLCEGQTIILTVNTPKSGETYQWTGPNSYHGSGSSINRVANSVNAGNYYITASNGTCTSLQSSAINVVVNPLPTVDAGSNVTVHCQGVPANLNATFAGGTGKWSLVAGPAGLNLFNLISVPNENNPNAAILPTAPLGTYQLRFTVTSAAGCIVYDEVEVNIEHPTPSQPTASVTSPVCEGSDFTLSVLGPIAGLTYEWFGPNNFRATGSTVVRNAVLSQAGNYTVIAGNGMCNSPVSPAVTLVVNPMPIQPVAWNNSPVCEHDTLKLYASAVPNATYHWTGPNYFVSTLQNPAIPNVTLAAAGIYWVTVTSTIGNCSAEPVPTVVFIKPGPTRGGYILSNPVCDGDKLLINFSHYDAKATYYWQTPNRTIYLSDTNIFTINYSKMADSGKYSVYMEYTNGCYSLPIYGNAIVNPIPMAPVIGNQITKCELDTIFLKSNSIAGAAYIWSGPGGYTSNLQNPDPFIASTTTEGVYSLYVRVKGCNSPVSKLLITINPLPATPVLVTNGPLCWGEDLVVTVNNPLAGGTYVWTHPDVNHAGGNQFISTVPQLIIKNVDFPDSGVYKAKVIGSRCTSLTGNVKLIVNPLPDATITPSGPTEFCQNDSVTLTAPSGPGYTYLWSTGQVTQSIVVKVQGWYFVTVTTAAGCKSIDSIYITVWELPSANAGIDDTISKGYSTQLHGSGGVTYMWSVVSGDATSIDDPPTIPEPVVSPLITTTYMLVVGSEHGCLDTDYVTVYVIEDYILEPTNLITANGDGINDVWYVGNIINYPDNKVMIFNRFGDKIYEVKGYSNTWTGEGYPNGTYYYVIIFDKSDRVYKGFITVVDKK